MTPEQHHKEAERLLKRGKQLLGASRDPDAAGSAIRAEWAQRGRDLFAEAAVHAAFATPAVSHPESTEEAMTND